VSFVALFFVPAAYGRHARPRRWSLPARWGWFVMESPAVLVPVAMYLASARTDDAVALVFLLLWLCHYVDRAWLYPFRLAPAARAMPWDVVALAFVFQIANSLLHGIWLFDIGPRRPLAWLVAPRFLVGVLLFALGWAVNRWADAELRRLRGVATGYALPLRGLYRWISCPNYLGEIGMWIGWAVATWAPPAAAFALWTIANLAPRARRHHRWYRDRFPDYPAARRALIPKVW